MELDFGRAREALAGIARGTPLVWSPGLSEVAGVPVHLKLENLQVTGSFKVRGAAARLTALGPAERSAGVVVSSSGNHGRAVAFVAERLGIPAVVCVPDWVDPVKLEAIRGHGARAVLSGGTFDEAEARALEIAAREGLTFVSAFDDPWVIAGQGTLALEIVEELPGTGHVLAALSGGGLVGGMAAAVRAPGGPDLVAVTARRARVMWESLRAGRPVSLPEEETVAGALAGGIGEENRYSFDLVRSLVEEHVVVEEDEILDAIAFAFKELHVVVEGGGAVGLAAVLSRRWRPPPGDARPVVIVVSGGNVAFPTLREILAR
ncbi:MAG: pyridoxal-phosphate dependent enzyme [Gemmatimonadota bacterium]|nr:pyridoxal-phosphate dependent enzyme [Gemmatimonadota bacterium]